MEITIRFVRGASASPFDRILIFRSVCIWLYIDLRRYLQNAYEVEKTPLRYLDPQEVHR